LPLVAVLQYLNGKAMTKYKSIEIKNRKATYEYEFIDTYEAGIVLAGTEVKSVKAGHANLNDAFCFFNGSALWIHSLYIKEYDLGTHDNHAARKDRKLLLRKGELKKLERAMNEKGLTIIPYKLYVNERGYIKLEIALARGKKAYDKRASIKEKDTKRELERITTKYK
jgi:SsrA-binding protein